MIRLKNNKGFTLVELILTLAIMSILIVPLSSFFINTAKTNNISDDKMKATLLAQRMMEGIKSLNNMDEYELKSMFDDIKFDYSIKKSKNNFSGLNNPSIISHPDDFDIDIKIDEIKYFDIGGGDNGSEVNITDYDIILEKGSNNTIKVTFSNKDIFSPNKVVYITGDTINMTLENKNNNNNADLILLNSDHPKITVNLKKINNDIKCISLIENIYDYNVNVLSEVSGVELVFKNRGTKKTNLYNNKIYDIAITVKKDNKVLQNIRGSKIVNN